MNDFASHEAGSDINGADFTGTKRDTSLNWDESEDDGTGTGSRARCGDGETVESDGVPLCADRCKTGDLSEGSDRAGLGCGGQAIDLEVSAGGDRHLQLNICVNNVPFDTPDCIFQTPERENRGAR